MKRWLAAALFFALSACATMGAGSTVDVLFANSASIAIEYTKWYQQEFGSAMATAQQHCQVYGKNAQLATSQPGANPYDRVIATFNCI